MAITPSTNLYLLQVPIEIDNANQLTFANATAQHDYFFGLTKDGREDFTYQRKDSVIRYPANIDSLMHFNYVMYQNENYSNKWFYAFITNMQYINDNMTEITITTDVYQTWMFDIEFKQSFVEREHVNDDTIGANLIPENLELGEYITTENPTAVGILGESVYVINATEAPDGTQLTAVNIGGIPIAGGLVVFLSWQSMINNIHHYYSAEGKNDALINGYVVPRWLVPDSVLDDGHGDDDEHFYYIYNGTTSEITSEDTITAPSTIDGYTPKNNKMLTAPFVSFMIANNSGSVNSYSYEYFANRNNIKIKGVGIPTIGCSMMVYPLNYKGVAENYNEGLVNGKFPTLSWSEDAYTNWLTQNAVNLGVGFVSDATQAGSALVSGATSGIGSAIGGLADTGLRVASQMSAIYQHSLVPDTVKGNTNSGDVLSAMQKNKCYLYKVSIKNQFARKCDDYFSMFGYKVNSLKLPNIHGRANWNYVKTADANIEGYIPQEDLQTIKDMLNTGVTFWHNPATFLDYSQSNNII